MKPRILAISAGYPQDSISSRLLTVAMQSAEASGGDVSLAYLDSQRIPFALWTSIDVQRAAECLSTLVADHDGVMFEPTHPDSAESFKLGLALNWLFTHTPSRDLRSVFHRKTVGLLTARYNDNDTVRRRLYFQLMLNGLGALIVPDGYCGDALDTVPGAASGLVGEARCLGAGVVRIAKLTAPALEQAAHAAGWEASRPYARYQRS